jgi:hypothetical protein
MPFSLSEDELRKTEEEIGATFPHSYRQAMMQANGGAVATQDDEWELFPIRDQSTNKHISRSTNHILDETKQAQKWNTFPENAYALGSNGTGDLLVMFQAGKAFDEKIFIWHHEDGSLIKVANDFSELERL